MKAKLLFLVFLLGVTLQSLAQINITTQPVPNVTVCEGGTLTLSVEATGIGLTYQWYCGTAIIPLAFYPTYTSSPVTIAEAGLYNCVISSTASPSVTSSNAIVTVNPAPTIAPIAPISACDSYTLPSYNDSMFVTTGAAVTHYYLLPGGPTVTGNIEFLPGFIITASQTIYPFCQFGNSCFDDTPMQITLYQTPVIAPIAPVTVCDAYTLPPYSYILSTVPVTHYYSSPGGPMDPVNIEKYPGDLILSTTTLYAYAESGALQTTCYSEMPFNITVNHTPVIAPITPVTVCDAYTLPPYSYILSTVPVTHYSTTATGPFADPTPIIYAPGATVYAFAETATIPNCWATSPFVITVHNTPTIAPIAPVSVCNAYPLPSYIDPMFVTTGATVTHYYTMQGGPTVPGNTERYPGDLVTATTTLYPYNNQIGNSCWTDAPWQININQAPNIITPLPPITNFTVGQIPMLSVVASGTNLNYQWYHNGVVIVGGEYPEYTIEWAQWAGPYCCVVSGLCAPLEETCTQVTVNPLSVLENSKVDFSVYPNPASNTVTVQYSNASNTAATIAVYDLQGKQVLKQETSIENNQSRISIASLQSGLYLMKITTADASVTKKLMVN
jgi:hypothetical protein